MNGGTLKRVMTAPLVNPTIAQTNTAARQLKLIPRAPAWVAPANSRMRRQLTTADSAIKLPTERSIPPEMITTVIPMAMMAMIAT
jgi:hypothetical protein